MIELLSTVVIVAGSMLLFGYWFRYTCFLILHARPTRDFAADFAAANQLSFLDVQARLREGAAQNLDNLSASLNRDYALIRSLIESVAGVEDRLEVCMLQVNYHMMHAWYGLSRRFSMTMARKALEEMSMVVAHFANSVGEQAAAGCAA